MKTKSRIKIGLGCLFGLITILCFTMAYWLNPSNNSSVLANEILIESDEIADEYSINTMFELPQTISVSENVTGSNGKLIFPSGVIKTERLISLSELGTYKVVYQTDDGVASKNFDVKNKVYSFSSSKSTAVYKDGTEGNELNYLNSTTIEGKESAYKGTSGISLHLANGDSFTFNKVFDVNELMAKNGTSNLEVINVLPGLHPIKQSVDDVAQNAMYFIVKVVDAHNTDNYVEFVICKGYNGKGHSAVGYYSVAGHSGDQYLAGFENQRFSEASSKNYEFINGEGGYIASGAIVRYPGKNKGTYVSRLMIWHFSELQNRGGLTFNYDFVENQYFEVNKLNGTKNFISDLDDSRFYNNPFAGFTTGEVFVTLTTAEFPGLESFVDIDIVSIFGLKGEELKDGLSGDEVAPRVTIDVDPTFNGSVNVFKGYPYTLPSISYVDANKCTVKTEVIYDYGTANQTFAYVENGKFIPNKLGACTVVYTVTDTFGNARVATLPLNVSDGKPFSFDDSNKIESLVATTDNQIPAINVSTSNKNVTTSVFIENSSGERVDITDSLVNGYYTYFADSIGAHNIIYIFTDNAYTEEFTYSVNSVDEGKVSFVGNIKTPTYFIKDAIYDLGEYYGYVASDNGLTPKLADIYIKNDGGEYEKIANPRGFKIEANETVQFKAQYGDGFKEFEEVHEVVDVNITNNKEVNDGKKYYSKYFKGYDSLVGNASSITYNFDGGVDESLTFINAQAFNAIAFEYEIPDTTAFKEFSIRLAQIGDFSKGYLITYSQSLKSGMVGFKVTTLDKTKVYTDGEIEGTLLGSHSISITKATITIGEGKTVKLDDLSYGYVEASFEFKAPTEAFSFTVKKVANQVFSDNIMASREAPVQLSYLKPIMYTPVGTVYTLPNIYVNDVFYPASLNNLKFTLTDANRQVVTDVNGKTLTNQPAEGVYTFAMDTIGVYDAKFIYSYNGVNKRFASDAFSVGSTDNIGPTVTFADGFNENTLVKTKVGATHTIKGYTIVDNKSATENIYSILYVIEQSYNSYVDWKVSEVTFTEAGFYMIMVYTIDEDNNVGYSYYNVLVEA